MNNLVHIKSRGCHKYVTNEDFLSIWKRLGFEIVEDTADVVSSSIIPEAIESIKIDYSKMSFVELKKLAKESNIDTYKIKKEDIIKALQEAGG